MVPRLVNDHNHQPGDDSRIGRLRVSYIATRIHARLCDEIRHPEAFANLFTQAPVSVQGLCLTLPYEINMPSADSKFTFGMVECSLKTAVDRNLAEQFRRAGIPLRHRCRLEVGAPPTLEFARLALEARVHPYGIVSIATADLLWGVPVSLAEARRRVEDRQRAAVVASVAGVTKKTTLGQAAADAADELVQRLATDGTAMEMPDYRIATIIAGSVDQPPVSMPGHRGPVHQALHFLSRGGDALAFLHDALVAQWSGGTFVWEPVVLVYMRDQGATTWSVDRARRPPTDRDERTSTRHRWLVALLSHITASVGLIHAAGPDSGSNYFESWAKTAADRMGRLYGPAVKKMEPGLEARAFLRHTRAVPVIERMKGCALTETIPDPPYPPEQR